VHNPDFFERYTAPYYREVAERVHAKGKYLAIHVDGEMKGALAGMDRVGVDCIDAATPYPMFSLTPEEAREEAGPDLILSGGVPATVFGSTGTDLQFEKTVQRWLDTKKLSHRLILAAGDQVPPDAPWHRIAMLPDLVKKYGRYT
jgi:uroporphyrinogen-III decarboxylase